MNLRVLKIEKEDIEIWLPPDRSEIWKPGEIIDDTFPNSNTRRNRVMRSGISPTITATGMAHIFYYEAYENDDL